MADVWSSNSTELPSANMNCRVFRKGIGGEKHLGDRGFVQSEEGQRNLAKAFKSLQGFPT